MCEEKRLEEIKKYVEIHLDEEISLKKLSDAVCYSGEYVSRFFKKATGMNLFDYIRKYRLLRAARELREGKGKIIDVAVSCGFNSHEGFSRAFASQFGLSPLKFRKTGGKITLFMPSGVKSLLESRKEKIMEELVIFTQIVERPARKLLILRGKEAEEYFAFCEEMGCDVWGRLLEIKEALYEPIGMWLPEALRPPGTSLYAQGVEVPADYTGKVPEGMECLELSPCAYLIFQTNPFKDDDDIMAAVIQRTWKAVEEYNPRLYGFEWAPGGGPRFQWAPLPERGYIEGYPVRRIS